MTKDLCDFQNKLWAKGIIGLQTAVENLNCLFTVHVSSETFVTESILLIIFLSLSMHHKVILLTESDKLYFEHCD